MYFKFKMKEKSNIRTVSAPVCVFQHVCTKNVGASAG